jgi:hypothetical protein
VELKFNRVKETDHGIKKQNNRMIGVAIRETIARTIDVHIGAASN